MRATADEEDEWGPKKSGEGEGEGEGGVALKEEEAAGEEAGPDQQRPHRHERDTCGDCGAHHPARGS